MLTVTIMPAVYANAESDAKIKRPKNWKCRCFGCPKFRGMLLLLLLTFGF